MSTLREVRMRLYSQHEEERQAAVRALGELAADRRAMREEKLRELLRGFFWALNDESGAVPYGAPEAIGEILAARPEFQAEFLGMLCGLATEDEVSQTGPVERGVFWALGRVGPAVARRFPEAAVALAGAAQSHSDPETRLTAQAALERLRAPD